MKMQRALSEFITEGIITNAEFQMDLISHPAVIAGDYSTAFYKKNFTELDTRNGDRRRIDGSV